MFLQIIWNVFSQIIPILLAFVGFILWPFGYDITTHYGITQLCQMSYDVASTCELVKGCYWGWFVPGFFTHMILRLWVIRCTENWEVVSDESEREFELTQAYSLCKGRALLLGVRLIADTVPYKNNNTTRRSPNYFPTELLVLGYWHNNVFPSAIFHRLMAIFLILHFHASNGFAWQKPCSLLIDRNLN